MCVIDPPDQVGSVLLSIALLATPPLQVLDCVANAFGLRAIFVSSAGDDDAPTWVLADNPQARVAKKRAGRDFIL